MRPLPVDIVVPYWPSTVRAIGLQVEGFAGYLYSQGGTPKADAEVGVDAWAKTLAFLEESNRARGISDLQPMSPLRPRNLQNRISLPKPRIANEPFVSGPRRSLPKLFEPLR